MNSSSGKHRRRSSRRSRSLAAAGHARRPVQSDNWGASESFAPPPSASRGTIRLRMPPGEPPIYRVFLAAFCAVALLILFGSGQHAAAWGLALLFPGVALVLKPPKTGLGKFGDYACVALLGCFLLAFVPVFYWSIPEWRVQAVDTLGIQLPAVLSVQPWISFESWLLALAGFGWLYAALQWPVNVAGRRRLYFGWCVILCVLAGFLFWGNMVGARYPGAAEADAFSFSPNQKQTMTLLVMGGVSSFAYAMSGLRSRQLLPLMGLPATSLCLAALIASASQVGVVLYFGGIVLWFLASLRTRHLPRSFKIAFPLVVLGCMCVLMSNERTLERIGQFFEVESTQQFRWELYSDVVEMVRAAPVSGFGLGTFAAVFPQYRAASAQPEMQLQPENDLLWLAAEGGLLAVFLWVLFLCAFAWRCRGIRAGASASYRLLALIVVVLFLVDSWMNVSGHRAATVYLAILFAALALPGRGRPACCVPVIFWRGAGVLLILFGCMWLCAGVLNAPWHSSVRIERYASELQAAKSAGDFERAQAITSDWLNLRPLDWSAYSQRAQLTLAQTQDPVAAELDFQRARFVEPVLGVVSFVEADAWLPTQPARVVAAWHETLQREMPDMDRVYHRMLQLAAASPELQSRLGRMSTASPHYRALFLCSLSGEAFTREIQQDLAQDPALAAFSREQRTEVVRHWIESGDQKSAAAFVASYAGSLKNAWWLRSLLFKGRADFDAAVLEIRNNVIAPDLDTVDLDETARARLVREFAVAPEDVIKGTTLYSSYLEMEAYERALSVVDRLLLTYDSRIELYYWRAECLYQLQDYIESWYTFETYLESLWGPAGLGQAERPGLSL
ncbi:O-antigen ligase family protein [Coraliomargarita sp. SDUM461004]|uniref:O-antigen ligase family protein n=1 Tax=Thalassobacterium sedimentorum TaxID=3041258 RepID=A0ABU1AI52_9BACT|nr:O-antigen ligase family protein [Coraliomargarita sp. SDUM461004]MDQ8194458.1 O-antigen ligase family protein [Coraliomargarita sp. SDUM461004]